MAGKRKVEVFSAGCACCEDSIEQIRKAGCPSCEVIVLDMRTPGVADRARRAGIRSVPAVVIEGEIVDCCSNRGPVLERLRAAGLGVPAA